MGCNLFRKKHDLLLQRKSAIIQVTAGREATVIKTGKRLYSPVYE